MPFVINQNDAVFEKDLGKETVQATAAISEFNPDKSGARGVTAILEEKRSFGKNRGRQVRIADHLTYGNQRRRRGVSSELNFVLADRHQPSPRVR